ncbi:MAG TPA: type II toxin-antitoxin system RelE/ParE family toxin [Polyangia bacterium]|nr:type II toxin-antitoxin system RelE/ParE family toxin [Polyangia bacterium]
MSRVRWAPQAAEDLQAIREFIRRDSPRYATAVVEQIIAAVDVLDRFPLAGRIVPEHARDDLRELIRPPYRIVYRVLAEGIHVVTVFRTSQLIPALP